MCIRDSFKGIEIETTKDVFDEKIMNLMDFDCQQYESVHFFYTLPFSKNKAMVETTWLSKMNNDLEMDYDQQLKNYIENHLNIKNYKINYKENGAIPLFYPSNINEKNKINIGTAGHMTRLSTGYTFLNIQEHSRFIRENIDNIDKIRGYEIKKKYQFLDKIFLRVLNNHANQMPNIFFKMFDNLLILDTGGFPIYYGNPVESVIYFKKAINHVTANESECHHCGNVNPEQIFNIIETKVVDEYGNITGQRRILPKTWNEIYKKEIDNKEARVKSVEIPKGSYKIPKKTSQFKVFFVRDILSKLANTQYMLINFLEGPFLAFLLSYLVKFYSTDSGPNAKYLFRYNENISAYLFISIVVALFMGLTVSAEEIISDRKILKREIKLITN